MMVVQAPLLAALITERHDAGQFLIGHLHGGVPAQ